MFITVNNRRLLVALLGFITVILLAFGVRNFVKLEEHYITPLVSGILFLHIFINQVKKLK